MNWGLYAAFVAASATLVITPGPIVALIMAQATRHGRHVGFATVLGTTIAGTVQLGLVVLGFAALVATFSAAFDIVRVLGAVYLIGLGVLAIRNAGRPHDDDGLTPADRASVAFRRGLLVALSNPKTLIFFSAFLPLFVDARLPAAPQLLMLAVTYVAIALVMDLGWMLLAARAGRVLTGLKVRAALERVTGGVLIAGGLALAGRRG